MYFLLSLVFDYYYVNPYTSPLLPFHPLAPSPPSIPINLQAGGHAVVDGEDLPTAATSLLPASLWPTCMPFTRAGTRLAPRGYRGAVRGLLHRISLPGSRT